MGVAAPPNTSMPIEDFFWRYRWAVALGAGAAVGAAYPPTVLGPLAWVGLVPILALLDRAVELGRRWFGLLYLFAWAWHGAANWWVMSWQRETDPYLMVAGAVLWLVHPLFLMPALAVYAVLRKRNMTLPTALVVMAALMVGVEWLHSLGDLSYPWLALGYTQLRSSALAQIADLTGVWGVSLIVVALNAVVYGWMRQTMSRHAAHVTPVRGALQLGGWMLAVIAPPLLYGVFRLIEYSPHDSKPSRIAVVQPNINPWRKWAYADVQPMLEQHIALQDSVRRTTPLDLVLWSETALPINLLDATGAPLLQQIQRWCDSTGTAILTGFADIERYRPLRAYNAAVLIAPNAVDFPLHRKSRLTPFGEYMPFSDALPELARLLQWGVGISSWAKGPGATVLPLCRGGDTVLRLGVMICIESIYPAYCADYVRRGADVLAVITNDAWYDGTPGPDQHFAIAQMRAIETRRPVVRCTNSGISGFISPLGTVLARAPAQKALALVGTVSPQQEKTFYVQAGDWLPVGLLFIAGGMIIVWMLRPTVRGRRDTETSSG